MASILKHVIRGMLGAACLAAVSLAGADSPWLYGIHWYGDANQSDVEAMTGGKAIWDLETVMVYDSGWSISTQAPSFQKVVAKGHTIAIRIQPRWGMAIPATSAERTQYLADVQSVAQQAANYCHIWQIGNEMNLAGEYGGQHLDPVDYINFYKQVRSAIHNVSSPLGPQIVVVGPVSPGAVEGERWMEGNAYLGAMCAAMNSSECDGFGMHAYGAPWYDAANAVKDFHNGYSQQLNLIDNYGFASKPVYIFEYNRQSNPTTDANQEAQSAQFLIGALQDIQSWNSNRANHPIACASWFIYPNYSGWEMYSILYMRGVNPRGVNQDLWDSCQYACTLNIPAGSQTPPPAVVVDNPSATYAGTWLTGTGSTDKYASDYRYKTAGTGTSYVEYKPNLPGGTTEVYAWWPQGTNRTTAAEFKITHANGTSTVYKNQQSDGGKWNLIGSYTFNAGTAGSVRVTDNFSGTGVVMADAIKFVCLAPADVIVDNVNAGFSASANWASANWAADKYGSDYRYRSTQPTSDAATWSYSVPQSRNYEIYAWWSAYNNRSATAPYVVYYSGGSKTVSKNQQTNGGGWQSLGTYSLNAGSNQVKLSCWTTTGYIVIGDAIKVCAR